MSAVHAAFDSPQAVAAATKRLESFGFSRASIRFYADTHFRDFPPAFKQSTGVIATLGNFLANLTGPTIPFPPGLYESTIRRGGAVLVVQTETHVEAQTARELLRNAGSIDIEARNRLQDDAVSPVPDVECFQEGVFEIREQVEVITLTKVARVVEELAIHKSVSVYTETIDDTLRRTAVMVEPIPAAGAAGTTETGDCGRQGS